MAKKKSSKAQKKKGSSPELPPERKEAASFLATVDEAITNGSYAGVRMLAAHPPDVLDEPERAALVERVERVSVDRVQLAVAGFAFICVMLAAALTLVSG